MKSLTLKQITVLITLLLIEISVLSAQKRNIVADEYTHLPIEYVNIYTSNAGNVRATNSDKDGMFEIDFDFQDLVFSHISYNKISIEKAKMSDTIFLTPNAILLQEVIVTNAPQTWIDNKLKEVVKQKKKNYRTKTKDFTYRYDSYTLSDSAGYAFQSSGTLQIPFLTSKERYSIDAQKNIIKYKDNTAGTDFTNLRRILYDDFIVSFDNKFIKDNNFSQNMSFENENDNLVQVLFSNKNYDDVSGYLILDTLNNVIVEVEQNAGTDYNIKTGINGLLRNYASSKGFSYNILESKVKTSYKKSGNSYYLSESKYKLTQKQALDHKKHKWTFFHASEAQLFVGDETQINTAKMIVLPEIKFMIAIYTKKMRQEDEALQNVPKTFEKF